MNMPIMCMTVCIYVCMKVLNTHMYVRIYVCMCIHIHMYASMYIYVCMCRFIIYVHNMYANVYICVCMWIYIRRSKYLPMVSASHPPRKAPIIPPGMNRAVVSDQVTVMVDSDIIPYLSKYVSL